MYLDHFSDFVIQNRSWAGETEREREGGREGESRQYSMFFSAQSELNLTGRPGYSTEPYKISQLKHEYFGLDLPGHSGGKTVILMFV